MRAEFGFEVNSFLNLASMSCETLSPVPQKTNQKAYNSCNINI